MKFFGVLFLIFAIIAAAFAAPDRHGGYRGGGGYHRGGGGGGYHRGGGGGGYHRGGGGGGYKHHG